MGFTYSTTIACAQKWYPHKKGLITGIIVSALGFGGVAFTPIVEVLIETFGGKGLGEQYTFMILAGIFLVVCCSCSFLLKNPPEGYMPAVKVTAAKNKTLPVRINTDHTVVQMLRKPQFYLIIFTFLLACMGGLMAIGFAKPIATAMGLPKAATMASVMIVSSFNSLGRLLCGIISDKIGRISTIIIILGGTVLIAPFVVLTGGIWGGYLIFVLIALIGFCYGGLLSTFPSLTAEQFGTKNVATNYGIVLLGFGAGAIVSSFIAGYYANAAGADINLMFPAFMIASACAAAGIVMMVILKVLKRKESKKDDANKTFTQENEA